MFHLEQIIAHGIGDYVLQSDQMAVQKTKSHRWALFHGIFYTIPFLFLTTSPEALLIIAGTHYLIDRYRLAMYVVWVKTLIDAVVLSPWDIRGYFTHVCNDGFPEATPGFLRVWIYIIVDNLLHITINAAAIYYFG